MFRLGRFSFGGAGGRIGRKLSLASVASLPPSQSQPEIPSPAPSTSGKTKLKQRSAAWYSASEAQSRPPEEVHDYPQARPSGMSAEREQDLLQRASRMQERDVSGSVPVPSFLIELLKKHPSVSKMGLRERMDVACTAWDALSRKKKEYYLGDPLRGVLPGTG